MFYIVNAEINQFLNVAKPPNVFALPALGRAAEHRPM